MIKYPDLSKLARLFDASGWIYAKTMPANPHWYTLRKNWERDEDFAFAVQTIRTHGTTELFRGWPYTILSVNGFKYWTMGAPVNKTILINRKPLSYEAAYDAIAPTYDQLFTDPASRDEDVEVIAKLDYHGGSLLDIGCGTGLLLGHITPDPYLGIDPSTAMLERLKAKYPAYSQSVMNVPFEEFGGRDGLSTFDYIVSLYGSCSYLDPNTLRRIPDMLNPGGFYFLMFYLPNYFPVTYLKTGVEVPNHNGKGAYVLDGVRHEYHRYVIVHGRKPFGIPDVEDGGESSEAVEGAV